MAQIRYEWRGGNQDEMVSLVIEAETSEDFLFKVTELDRDGRFKGYLPKRKS